MDRAFKRVMMRGGGSVPFVTPASLFAGGRSGDWWDATTISTLTQDSAGATPVAADNDPVGRWRGKVNSTDLVQATAGAKPLYKASNTSVLLDGVDDFLMTASNLPFAGYPFSIVILFDQSVNGGAAGGVVSLCAHVGDYMGITLNTPGASSGKDRGAANTSFGAQSYPAGSGLAAAIATFASGAQTFQFNNGTVATGTATNSHLAGLLIFGALRQTAGVPSLLSAARVQQIIAIDKVLTAQNQADLLAYWGL